MILCCLGEGLRYLPAKNNGGARVRLLNNQTKREAFVSTLLRDGGVTRASSSPGGTAQRHIYLQSFRALRVLLCSAAAKIILDVSHLVLHPCAKYSNSKKLSGFICQDVWLW